MRLDQEDNRTPEEASGTKEYNRDAKEEPVVREFLGAREVDDSNKEYTESQKVKKIKKNAEAGGRLATGAAVVGVASLVVIGTSGLVNINMDGEIESLVFQDNKIVYNVNVSDVEEGNTMYFEIYEGKASKISATKEIVTDVTEPLNGSVTGEFDIDELHIGEKLKTVDSLSFTFRLCGNTGLVNRTYDSYILEVNQLVSEFNSISYRSDYTNSGCFKFLMDFSDDYGVFTDFAASITDCDGNVFTCSFTEDLHEEQSIFILESTAGTAIFEVTFKNNGIDEVYSYEVLI